MVSLGLFVVILVILSIIAIFVIFKIEYKIDKMDTKLDYIMEQLDKKR